MDYKKFKQLIEANKNTDKFINKCSDILNADLWETPMFEEIGLLRDTLFEEAFGEDGMDIINWWLYENVDHTITHQDGTKYHLKTPRDLYNYVTTCLDK